MSGLVKEGGEGEGDLKAGICTTDFLNRISFEFFPTNELLFSPIRFSELSVALL